MNEAFPDYVGNQPRRTLELAEWLGRGDPSPIIDPEIPIVDPHHHLFGSPNDPLFYEMGDIRDDLDSGHRVIATVYVEAYDSGWRTSGPEQLRPVGEIEKIVGLTREPLLLSSGPCRVAAGIIGHAEMTLGDAVQDVLEAEIAAAEGRFRGVRHRTATIEGAIGKTIKDPPRPNLMLDRNFQKAVAHLGARELTFDAWVYHTQLDELQALADAAPDTAIIVNHVGGPIGVEEFRAQRPAVLRQWESSMRSLAARPNVRVKIGGLGMPLYGFDVHRSEKPSSDRELATHWRPLVDQTIDIFGPERCMFESNFPVDKQSTTYLNLWNAFKILTEGYSRTEKSCLFYRTACNVYRLPEIAREADALW